MIILILFPRRTNISLDPENSRGIIFGGSGQAEMMVANKFKTSAARFFYTKAVPIGAVDSTGRKSEDPLEVVRLTREHNNANILSLACTLFGLKKM